MWQAKPADSRSLGLDVVVRRGDERVADPGEGAGLVWELNLNRCRCVASRLALRCHSSPEESLVVSLLAVELMELLTSLVRRMIAVNFASAGTAEGLGLQAWLLARLSSVFGR